MANEEKQVAEVQPEKISIQPQDNSIEGFISAAIQQQLPIETIKEFLAMRKELKADQAKESFVRAMAKLQGELPTIKKLKDNGGTGSKYAPLEDIVSQSKKVIADNNFSYNWDTKTTEKHIEVVCKVTHAEGHIETSTMVSDVAEGTKANNEPQKAAITITYLKRYTLCNLFGIVVADEDMDARNDQNKTPEQKKASHLDAIQLMNVDAQLKQIDGARDLKSLQKIWLGFNPDQKQNNRILEAKDTMKAVLEQDAVGSEEQLEDTATPPDEPVTKPKAK